MAALDDAQKFEVWDALERALLPVLGFELSDEQIRWFAAQAEPAAWLRELFSQEAEARGLVAD